MVYSSLEVDGIPRFARVVVPACPHHITHRGNRRDPVFFSDDDRMDYLEILLDFTRRYAVDIWGYCLLPTHVHLIAVPAREEALGLAIGRAHMKYARHANRRQHRWVHLWVNRFYSTPLDDAHCWTALKYLGRNPLRAGMVDIPWDYSWSSAGAHVVGDPHPVLTPCPLDSFVAPGAAWGAWLTEATPDEEAACATVCANTYTGWPTGSTDFVTRLEAQLERRLSCQPAGRKKRQGGNI